MPVDFYNEKGISLIICCYNSSDRLPVTIEYLSKQNIPTDLKWEIIIVNNSSTDNTEEIALREINRHPNLQNRFKVVYQPILGLTHARHLGVENAAFKYIIFCDDDNWLDSNYLSVAFTLMTNNKKIGALGGQSSSFTNAQSFPPWFEEIKNWYAVGSQAAKEGDISHVWGAGMITQKNLYILSYPNGFPSIILDRKGSQLSSGGDLEYCFRLLLMGYKLHYNQDLRFIHFIPKERLNLSYKKRLIQEGLSGSLELRKYYQLHLSLITKPIFKPFLLIKTLGGFISSILFNRKSWLYEDVIRILFFITRIDLGVDSNTKLIYNFYKNSKVRTKAHEKHFT